MIALYASRLSRRGVMLLPYRMVVPDRLKIARYDSVKGMTPDGGTIPNDQELAASPPQGPIYAAHVGEEAYFTPKVRPHQRQHDRFLSRPWTPPTLSISCASCPGWWG